MTNQIGQYPNSFYRISLKAVIRNEKGEVLVVDENCDSWGLPGGGFDHGETETECLLRELKEEVGYDGKILDSKIIGMLPMHRPEKDACIIWIVYELKLENDNFSVGDDAKRVAFMDPKVFKDSKIRSEKLVYKFCVDKDFKVPFYRD